MKHKNADLHNLEGHLVLFIYIYIYNAPVSHDSYRDNVREYCGTKGQW